MLQFIIHYALHFLFPLLIAGLFYRQQLWKTWFVFLLGMLIDADHLLASPVFDACRCSIHYHPLHSYPAIAVYVLMLWPARTRLIALGLLMHILADVVDCMMMAYGGC